MRASSAATSKANRNLDANTGEFYPLSVSYYRDDLIYIRDHMAQPNGLKLAEVLRSIVRSVVEDDRKSHETSQRRKRT